MIIDSFDIESEPIVNLEMFYGKKKKLIETCLIIFSKKIHDFIIKNYKCEKISEIQACNGSTIIYKLIEYEIGFYLSGIGSAVASHMCIECNWLTGATNFIMFGSSGSLDKSKTENKYIIPTKSYRDEGMSYHYKESGDYIEIKNSDRLFTIFKEMNLPCIQGKIWSTDAMLRETKNNFNKRKQDGCIAVEMEIAGVQAVCDFHQFELYCFLVTGDILTEDKYDTKLLNFANHDMEKYNISLEIAKRIKDI